jgi:hypothetical protein
MFSNGNSYSSYSNGHNMGIADRSREPWFTSGLLRPVQDRGSI